MGTLHQMRIRSTLTRTPQSTGGEDLTALQGGEHLFPICGAVSISRPAETLCLRSDPLPLLSLRFHILHQGSRCRLLRPTDLQRSPQPNPQETDSFAPGFPQPLRNQPTVPNIVWHPHPASVVDRPMASFLQSEPPAPHLPYVGCRRKILLSVPGSQFPHTRCTFPPHDACDRCNEIPKPGADRRLCSTHRPSQDRSFCCSSFPHQTALEPAASPMEPENHTRALTQPRVALSFPPLPEGTSWHRPATPSAPACLPHLYGLELRPEVSACTGCPQYTSAPLWSIIGRRRLGVALHPLNARNR